MNIKKEVMKAQRRYVDDWMKTSSEMYKNGDYKWMCEYIKGKKRVLEIGTGAGYSTLELVRNGYSVVSIDENLDCLKETKRLLINEGFKAEVLNRGKFIEEKNSYRKEYSSVIYSKNDDVVYLIEGDVLNDKGLIKWLYTTEPFDAVLCWLLGTYDFRMNNSGLASYNMDSGFKYRMCTELMMAELCQTILNDDGIYNIVMRLGGYEIDLKDAQKDCEERYTKFFERVIDLDKIEFRKSKNIINDKGKSVYATVEGSAVNLSEKDKVDMYLASIVFSKNKSYPKRLPII